MNDDGVFKRLVEDVTYLRHLARGKSHVSETAKACLQKSKTCFRKQSAQRES